MFSSQSTVYSENIRPKQRLKELIGPAFFWKFLISACFILWVFSVFTISVCASYLENVPQTITQPDGEEIACFASGDEYYRWIHDVRGFVIVRNSDTGYYVYGQLENGNIIPSSYIVGKVDPLEVGLVPDIKPSAKIIEQHYTSNSYASTPSPVITANANTGTLNNLVVFIRFKYEDELDRDVSIYRDMFNDTNEGESSLRNYFMEASYGQLEVNSTFYPSFNGSTVVSHQDTRGRGFYRWYDNPDNFIGYRSEADASLREYKLLRSAIEDIKDEIPSDLNLDHDNDGMVDNVCFIISGSPDGWSDLLWPHRNYLTSFSGVPDFANVIINGKIVGNYNVQLENTLNDDGVGVLCHEMFHSLGAKDLYHYSNDGLNPAYNWDLMGSDSNPPQHMTAYMKMRYGGWISSIPEITTSGSYSLKPLSSSTDNAYKITSTDSSSEYFVLEYRRKDGTFESSLSSSGLVVYRVNTARSGQGNKYGPPDELYVYRQGGTVNNEGNANAAAFNQNSGRTRINDTTDPSLFLSDGSPGGRGIRIYDIGNAGGATISFKVDLWEIETDNEALLLWEGQTRYLGVRLSGAPAADVQIAVSKSGPDASDMTMESADILTFTPENYNQYQYITLSAVEDTDVYYGHALIKLVVDNAPGKDVPITIGDWVGEGIALWDGAAVPFADGFESGNFSAFWKTYKESGGNVAVTQENNPRSGAYHTALENSLSKGLNELMLSVDLAGKKDVTLDLWYKEKSYENDGLVTIPEFFRGHFRGQGASISADGINWYRVDALQDGGDWTRRTINLDPLSTFYKAAYNSQFLIKLQWNNGGYNRGLWLDDISVTAGKTLYLETANGGERWQAGSRQYIQWDYSGGLGDNVVIELYKDGTLYDTLSYSTPNDGNFAWEIPFSLPHADDYAVKVSWLLDREVYDISDNTLEIFGPELTLTSPNGNERWPVAKIQTLTWTSLHTPGDIKIELIKTGEFVRVISARTEDDGSYLWSVPMDTPPGDGYKIAITSINYPVARDLSDNFWVIYAPQLIINTPDGGETWTRDQVHDIRWNVAGDPGSLLKIELYKGGMLHSLIHPTVTNDGSYAWHLPATLQPGTDYRVKVASISYPMAVDESQSDFSIIAGKFNLSSPRGGEKWRQGTPQNITWSSVGAPGDLLKLELYKNGNLDSLIADNQYNDGSYTWNVPPGQVPGTQYAVKISSVSYPAACFSGKEFEIYAGEIKLTSPNSREGWQRGTAHDIRWTSSYTAGNAIKLELYKAGLWDSLIIDSTANDGSYTWTIPQVQTAGGDYQVKISLAAAPVVSDTSDDYFKIFSVTPSGQGSWWMFQKDPQHTGAAVYTGPADPVEKWAFTTGSAVHSSAAIGIDGTIYIGSDDSKIYAIDANGSQKWTFTTAGGVSSSPAIGSDGTIYVGSYDGKLYALNPNGSQKWVFVTPWGVSSSPCVAADGTIYVGMGYRLYALNFDGTEKWLYQTGSWVSGSPAIAVDGTVYCGSADNKVYAVNPDGSLKWDFTTGGSVAPSPAVGLDGTIYISSEDRKFYALDPANGAKKWEFLVGSGLLDTSPALAADGTIYLSCYGGHVFALDPADGGLKWEFAAGAPFRSSPAIGGDGTVYAGSDNGIIYALEPSGGSKKWEFNYGWPINTSVVAAAPGTLYFGSGNGKVVAIENKQPAISGITPAQWDNRSVVTITDLAGTSFMPGASLRLLRSGRNDILAAEVSVLSPSRLTAKLDLTDQEPGPWDVMVINSDGKSAVLSGGFLIKHPAPALRRVTPDSVMNTGLVNLALTGTGFLDGAAVVIRQEGLPDIVASNTDTVSPLQITCTFNLTGVEGGLRDVVVSNADGQSAVLWGGFSVLASPVVATLSANNVTSNSAFLRGTLSSTGTASIVSLSFDYGINTDYGNTTYVRYEGLPQQFVIPVYGLTAGITYHFRVKADGGMHGVVYGEDISFTTPVTSPSVITGSASSIGSNIATLNGTLTSMGTAVEVTVSFDYGLTQDYGQNIPAQIKQTTGSFSTNLISLSAGTTYHCRAKADGGIHGIVYGLDVVFTAGMTPPAISLLAPANAASDSITLNGQLESKGTAADVYVSFEYGLTQDYGSTTVPVVKVTASAFSSGLTNLVPGNSYHYRAKADGGSHGIAYSADSTFTTLAASTSPTVLTIQATDVSSGSAILHGNLTSLGGAGAINVCFQYGVSTLYGSTTPVRNLTLSGTFTAVITGLSPGVPYYFRAKADGGTFGLSYGAPSVFTTGQVSPSFEIVTGAVENIESNAAALKANLLAMPAPMGGGMPGDPASSGAIVSFQYGTTSSYGSNSSTQTAVLSGPLGITISGLTAGTTYHCRAKAEFSGYTTAFGADVVFTTLAAPPTVTTNTVTAIRDTSAVLGGNLTYRGSAPAVNVSFDYGTTSLYGNRTAPQIKNTTGSYTAAVSGLKPGVTYHFRARADGNSHGIGTGSDFFFTTQNAYELNLGFSGNGSSVPPAGTYSYMAGSVVDITAQAAPGWQFINWSGDVAAVANPDSAATTVTLNSSCMLTANFIPTFNLNISILGNGTTNPGEGNYAYAGGTSVAVSAAPGSGWRFNGWSGHVIDSSPEIQIEMSSDRSITANFIPIVYSLDIDSNIGGRVTAPGQGLFSYSQGEVVNLNAIPNLGYRFLRWSGDVSDITDINLAETSVTMNADKTVIATFSAVVSPSAEISGSTWQVNGSILTGVILTMDGQTMVLSGEDGGYQIQAAEIGNHTIVARKTGFRSQNRTIEVTDAAAIYTLDFKGDHSLVPDASTMSYALTCINKWKFPPADGTALSMSKALSVINAWKFPIVSN